MYQVEGGDQAENTIFQLFAFTDLGIVDLYMLEVGLYSCNHLFVCFACNQAKE